MTLETFVSTTVGICGVLYLMTSVGYAFRGQWGWSLAYFAYALANVGLIIAGLEALKSGQG